MKQFTDSAGRAWTINLTIDAVKRIRSLLGVNLLEIEAGDPPLLVRLGTDVILLCDVIYAAVKPQADAISVTDEQFGSALGGEVIRSAQDAFYLELTDFFQKLGRRHLVKAVETQSQLIDQAMDAQVRMLDKTAKQITTQIEHLELETDAGKTLGPPSTVSLGSSA